MLYSACLYEVSMDWTNCVLGLDGYLDEYWSDNESFYGDHTFLYGIRTFCHGNHNRIRSDLVAIRSRCGALPRGLPPQSPQTFRNFFS
jgi:hypothetical protein